MKDEFSLDLNVFLGQLIGIVIIVEYSSVLITFCIEETGT
jgi:hypothetical protein